MTEFIVSFEHGLNVDLLTLAWLAMLSSIGAYLVREQADAAALGIISYPLFVASVLFTYHTVQYLGFLDPRRLDEWFVWMLGSAFIGIALGLLLIVAMARTKSRIGDRILASKKTRTKFEAR